MSEDHVGKIVLIVLAVLIALFMLRLAWDTFDGGGW